MPLDKGVRVRFPSSMKLVNSLVALYLRRYVKPLQWAADHPFAAQSKVFFNLLEKGRTTAFGRQHDFQQIRTPSDFAKAVPIFFYDEFSPYIEQCLDGQSDVIWPGKISMFATTSGTTTSRRKYIPVSREGMIGCQLQGGGYMMGNYYHKVKNAQVFDGRGLIMGGSINRALSKNGIMVGDLSALMQSNIHWVAGLVNTPPLELAVMEDWEEKIEGIAQLVKDQDIRSLSGMPSWISVLINRLFQLKGTDNLLDIWPNLELFMHGGTSFQPYKDHYQKVIPKKEMHYFNIFNASEGFFALQDRLEDDAMLLLTDNGVYFEFLPLESLDRPETVIGLSEVELERQYVMVVSTNSGLWRYCIGDTVEFASIKPYRFKLTGRTKLFLNTVGERLKIADVERAMADACVLHQASVYEYTVVPLTQTIDLAGGHEWLVEFRREPADFNAFAQSLDRRLKELNSDYEAKRTGDMVLRPPIVRRLSKGAFTEWMKKKGKLGGQHKVPRLWMDYSMAEELLTFSAQL